MYDKSIPYKNFKGQPKNKMVHFNLTGPEVFKLLAEFQAVFKWYESATQGEEREMETSEVIEFYTTFETILLAAWGEPSEDGEHFRKAGRYDFEESALFAATIMEFVTNPAETGKFLDGIMPADMQELVKTADANLAKIADTEGSTPEQQSQVADLRRRLAEAEAASAANALAAVPPPSQS